MSDRFSAVIGCLATAYLCAGCAAIREHRLLTPVEHGMEQIAPRIYVDAPLTATQRANLLEAVEIAHQHITAIYGSAITRPNVYAFASPEAWKPFNGFGDGRAVLSFGNRGVMLTPKSLRADALSHEWSHVELYERIGPSAYRKVPAWFNEGLAVLVSQLPRHSEDVWRELVRDDVDIPALENLRTHRQWAKANGVTYRHQRGRNVVYTTAGQEVRTWYRQVGQAGLLQLMAALRAGEDFDRVYAALRDGAAP